jgi:hypothetical protein
MAAIKTIAIVQYVVKGDIDQRLPESRVQFFVPAEGTLFALRGDKAYEQIG